MVHNGIEYGMMQAYAEGFSIMRAKTPLHLDLVQISEIWRYGSVVRSWLLDLTADALKKNPTLEGLEAYVPDSGEGRWTVFEAIDLNVSAPVITDSLIRRLRSREENNFTDRMLAVMRNEFGGHAVKKLSWRRDVRDGQGRSAQCILPTEGEHYGHDGRAGWRVSRIESSLTARRRRAHPGPVHRGYLRCVR